MSRCVTYDECTSIPDKDMFIIDNKECTYTCPKRYVVKSENGRKFCNYCGENCTKWCDGAEVENMNILKSLEGCTHINGSLTITLGRTATITQKDLVHNLEEIREIAGELKIQRTHQIENLDFLKNLTRINGTNTHGLHKYVVTIRGNPDLMRLSNWTKLVLGPGKISFHYNPMLCLSEIENFAKRMNMTSSFFPENIHISKLSNGEEAACSKRYDLDIRVTKKNATFATIQWKDLSEEKDKLIGYYVHFKPAKSCNESNARMRDNCGSHDWMTHLVTDPYIDLIDLTPFTSYMYYITILTNKSNSETPFMCFNTSVHDPSPPLDVVLIPLEHDTISLRWKPPEAPNGILSHYLLFGFMQKDNRTLLDRRNYCNRRLIGEAEPKKPADYLETELTNGTCNCDGAFSLNIDTLKKLCYYHDNVGLNDLANSCSNYKRRIEIINLPAESTAINLSKRGGSLTHPNFRSLIEQQLPPNITEYNITNLDHYTQYVFYFSACNSENGIPHCSAVIMESARTLRKDRADDIDVVSIDNDRNNTYVRWKEPKSPNGVIVQYNMVYGLVDTPGISEICIPRMRHVESDFTYVLEGLRPGQYEVKVQAVSLAGHGNFTYAKPFTISSSRSDIIILVAVIVFCALVGAVMLYFYHRYKKRRELDSLHLITTVNPEYDCAYIPDKWEMERSDIDIQKPLGNGTFGMVYRGSIKSQGIPCAIKTVNENSNMHDRVEFLNEASVMKSFNDAHHVVKLLGVVSKGQPPLVIMELMEREDLKTYLRASRESSQNITCLEMYRMAAEIADGMAYLAAKKFIHRDLAARNCMVSADYTVKIGDFGMARDIYETDYYRKESKGLLPVRWMAPESLADGVFTSDSDAWSYGVVLWEMVTLAEQPYQGLANEQVFQFVVARGTLDRPPDCPNLLYEIMQVCWKWRPYDRPLFTDIVDKLESHIGQDFRLVSFYHSREGEEYRMNNRERLYNPPALSQPLHEEQFVHWKTSDEEVSLYSGNADRPAEILNSYTHQRHSRPPSNYHLESSSSQNGYNALSSM